MTAPITVLVGALGGEGGGVLAGWLVTAARACGYPVQATSIPGVAQRTGATTYYVEIFPETREALGDREPVLALSPVPGQVDLMVSSELLEAARAAQGGMMSPERATLIASTHRTYTVAEKSAMADGRFDRDALTAALPRFAKHAILFDMDAAARRAGAVISAVMLGAIAGSKRLPLSREAFEEAIRASGKGEAASLDGFAAGFAAAGGDARAPEPTPADSAPVRASAENEAERVRGRFAPSLGPVVEHGYRRQVDFQNHAYGDLYLDRVKRVYRAECNAGAGTEFPVSEAYARFLALWMSYEDVIRVADLKTRAARYRRVREETSAGPGDLVRVTEYLKPGVEEWCAVLPGGLAARLRNRAARNGRGSRFFNVGLRIKTTSLHGFLLLRGLSALKWWRPYSSRYAEEQRLIERWSGAVLDALARDRTLALEIALCGRLIKGYGETHARGKTSFLRILDTIVTGAGVTGGGISSDAERAGAVRAAREAALADPEGNALERSLGRHGVAPLPLPPKPIKWHKPRAGSAAG